MNIIVYTFPFRGHSIQAILIANYLSEKGHRVVVDANPDYFKYISPTVKINECLYTYLKVSDDRKKNSILDCAEGVLVTTKKYIEQFHEKADLILFDSQAYWGKYISRKYDIPSASLMTIQPFTMAHFERFAYGYLRNYTCRYASAKDFFRSIYIYQHVAKKKFDLPDDFLFSDIICASGTINVVLLPRSFCRFSKEFGVSYRAFSPITDWLDAIPQKDGSIYIATGSMICDLELLISCIDALLPYNKEIHVSSGEYTRQLENKYHQRRNIRFYTFAPQKDLLKRASVFITHGGSNSICESVAARTPMIVIPLVNDEFLNAEMVYISRIGLMIGNNPETIKENLGKLYETLSENDIYVKNINEMAEQIDSDRVWNTIDEFIKEGTHGSV